MISVIVPVYNVEKFLRECIDSILVQSFRDFELILVDDGSTDSCGAICDEYANGESDICVKTLHQPNAGLSAARNAGIDIASGDWIAFIDSDDAVAENYLEQLLAAANNCGAQVASSAFTRQQPAEVVGDVRKYSARQAIIDTLYQKELTSSAWKLFKASLFDGLRFRPGIYYEDLDIICRIYDRVEALAYVDAKLYMYRDTPKSIINTFSLKRLDVLEVTNRIVEQYSCDNELSKAARDRQFAANFNMFILLARSGEYPEEALKCWSAIKTLRSEVILNPKSRIKNKIGALISYFGRDIVVFASKFVYK